jgi:hypothetical protein
MKNMPWILIAILVLILVVFGVFLYWKKNKAGEAKQPRYLLGGAIGGVIGSFVGIALVEFAGHSYPLPFILFLGAWQQDNSQVICIRSAGSKGMIGGTITCTEFVDINGKRHEVWRPGLMET